MSILHASPAPDTDATADKESIRVRIVLPNSLSPVAQCEVLLETGVLCGRGSGPTGNRRVERTGRDGTAVFANASSGFLDVIDEYYVLPGGRTYVEGPGEVLLEVIPRRGEVVTLLDAETATPLSGWLVSPLAMQPPEPVLPTDARGRTQLPWTRWPYSTFALWNGQRRFELLVLHPRSQMDVQFAVAWPNRSTRVRVVDADGQPVVDAMVFACHRNTGMSIAVDAEGQAAVEYVDQVGIEVTAPGKLPRRVSLSGEPTVEIRLLDAKTRRFTFDPSEPREWNGVCLWTLSYADEAVIRFSGIQQGGVMEVPDLPAEPFRCTLWAYGPDGVSHCVDVEARAIEQSDEVAVTLFPTRTLRLEVGSVTPGATELAPVRGNVWMYSGPESECGGAPGPAVADLRDMIAGRRGIGLQGGLSRKKAPTIEVTVPGGISWCVGVLADDGAYGRTSLSAEDPSGTRALALAQVGEETPVTCVRVEWADGRPVTMSFLQYWPEGSSESERVGLVDAAGILAIHGPPGRYRLRSMSDGVSLQGDRDVLVPSVSPQVVRMLPEPRR